MEKYIDNYEPAFLLDKDGIEKTAEEKKEETPAFLMDFIKSLKPDKDKHIYVHKVLLGDGEIWGSNKNGDDFPKSDLYADSDKFGYRTLTRAGIFTLHRNKDKSKTLGNVLISIVNPKMRRVELIEELDRDLCKEHDTDFGVYDRLLDGECLFSSMGCRVPYDICSICHNRAPTRAQYCPHLLYQMNQILPDGRRVRAINPRPDFFDDSYVRNPAFTPAFTINIYKSSKDVPDIKTKYENKESSNEKPKQEKTAEESNITPENKVQGGPTKKGKPVKVARKTTYAGIPINIEVMSGDYRIGYSRGGKWKKRMFVHYGFIPRTEGADGEEVDVYLKPDPKKDADVYVVRQMKFQKGEKSYDEDKVMLGFDSLHHAKSSYLQHMPEKAFGGIYKISLEDLKSLISKKDDSEVAETEAPKVGTMVKEIPAMSQISPILNKIRYF